MNPFYEILKTDFYVVRNRMELEFKEHLHKHVEILYVYSGTQHITVRDKAYAVSAGSAAVIFPNVPHSYFKDGQKIADARLIMFNPVSFSSLFPQFSGLSPICPIVDSSNISDETRFALTYLTSDKPAEIKLAYTIIIFSNLCASLQFAPRVPMPIRELLPQIINYIEVNYASAITRDLLAEEFGVSKYHISRLFSEQLKTNLKTYLGIIRCQKAAYLLRTSDFKITVISHLTGFDSIRSFNRAFKQNYGVTPSEYKYNK